MIEWTLSPASLGSASPASRAGHGEDGVKDGGLLQVDAAADDHRPTDPAWTRLRCAAPGAAACLLTVDFRVSRSGPCGDAVRA
jgi:hypothetical protein